MNAQSAIKQSLEMADFVCMKYLDDMSDEDLLQRPHPDCNHINYQLGHLVSSEHQLMKSVAPDSMPDLPTGFAETYSKEHAASDDASQLATKEQLLQAYQAQRAATLQVLEHISDSDLDKPTGIEYAPTVGAVLRLQGEHWLMHCGQWVIVRRQTGKPIVM